MNCLWTPAVSSGSYRLSCLLYFADSPTAPDPLSQRTAPPPLPPIMMNSPTVKGDNVLLIVASPSSPTHDENQVQTKFALIRMWQFPKFPRYRQTDRQTESLGQRHQSWLLGVVPWDFQAGGWSSQSVSPLTAATTSLCFDRRWRWWWREGGIGGGGGVGGVDKGSDNSQCEGLCQWH